MADPEQDHGFQGRVDILNSPFFDLNIEIDQTVEEYVERIIFTLAVAIDEQLSSVQNTPKIIEVLSSDGSSCSQIPSSRADPLQGKVWVSPSERYALVPDESVPNQATNLADGNGNEADVPENDVKRLRH
ncbi:hypothetical protein IEQ34_018154 [Dendrobium chrysotoxum]|uniref:Uncharacterized protein n=1 Tax=Dendrobium chrysotoxum TaxID=161865 RepID=A0AAV7GDN3_DENCH|nr:hypothetical protein IEQ34_018154 [Dendrobium chrysotoxum]